MVNGVGNVNYGLVNIYKHPDRMQPAESAVSAKSMNPSSHNFALAADSGSDKLTLSRTLSKKNDTGECKT